MKKALALILALALCLSLAACTGNTKPTDAPKPTDTKTTDTPTEPDNSGDKKPGEGKTLLYYCSNIGDFGLSDMGYRAANAAVEKYGYDLTLVEYGADTSQAVNSLVDALDTKHYDYVICMSWYISDTVIEKSKNGEWADITFIMYDTAASADLTGTNNIYGVSFAQNEGSFLVGVYSALMTKTGKIGCVINRDAPITNDFGTGWLCGYKYAVKELGLDVDMMLTYMGESTVQGDYESVNVLMDNGCDYVYNVGGAVALGAMQAAEEKGGVEGGKFIIGTDYDQYSYFESVGDVVGYKTMVTSMLKNIESCVAKVLANVNGEETGIEPGNRVYGIADNGTGLVENDWYKQNTPEDVQKKIAEISDKIAKGELKVVSYFDFETYDAFAAYRDNPTAEFSAK